MDVKNAVIGVALTASYALVAWAFMQILTLSDKQGVLVNEVSYINKQLETCVRKDVYEIDKLYLQERFKNHTRN